MKTLTSHERLEKIEQAQSALILARALLAKADAPKTLAKVRHALRSLDGAIRNRARFAAKENNYVSKPSRRHILTVHLRTNESQ